MPAEYVIWPTMTHSGLVVGTRTKLVADRIATIGTPMVRKPIFQDQRKAKRTALFCPWHGQTKSKSSGKKH